MIFTNKFLDKEKTSKIGIANPREVFNNILRQTSGSTSVRELKYDIFYQIFAFKGVVEGIGTSTLLANTAVAIASLGLTVLVVDTSILSPCQDILLNTNVSDELDKGVEVLDWFDMPYTKKSVLHVSKIDNKISVLSFKGRKRGVIDILSTNDSNMLADIAFTQLHNKFDIILVDLSHELSSVATACLQQSQQIIQVWNDAPQVLGNLENFITNCITLSCPLDKMRFVVLSKMCKEIMGSVQPVLDQYRLTKLAVNYISEEIALQSAAGKTLWNLTSKDEMVIDYNNCIVDIACHILNIKDNNEPKGTVTSNDIMSGKVEGTLTKKMLEESEDITNGINIITDLESADESLRESGVVSSDDKVDKKEDSAESVDESSSSESSEKSGSNKKKKGLFKRK